MDSKKYFDLLKEDGYPLLIFHLLLLHLFTTTISNYTASSLLVKLVSGALLITSLYKVRVNFILKDLLTNSKTNLILLLLFFCYPAVSLIYSSNFEFGLQKLIHLYITIIPIFPAVLLLIDQGKEFHIKIVFLSLFYSVLVSVITLAINPFIHHTAYAFSISRWSHVLIGRFLSITIIGALWLILTSTNKKRLYFALTSALLIGGALYLSALRASFLAVSIAALIMFIIVLVKKKLIVKNLLFPIISTVILLSVLINFNNPVSDKRFKALYTVITEGKFPDGAILARVEAYIISFEIFKSHPLLGTGIGGFNNFNESHLTKVIKYPHNLLLEFLTEMGIFFFILSLILFYRTAIEVYRYNNFLLPIFITALILSLFSKDFASNSLLLMFLPFLIKPPQPNS
ncbi:MAG TPA: O-antigen ligase family protein [Ignavibacteriaceae bacterium]|nr:O-antigen ligase family protein [Ignavibacteriaceae bacterium]